MAEINKRYGQPLFDFNIYDKRGLTPLHYAVEKQDYDLFYALM